ncbi:MAG: DUF3298 domain-containing protein [Lachnospiraceae bacterium]|nr:DUF3298 domain-containing protein [Lachnospiraceae bacterium]
MEDKIINIDNIEIKELDSLKEKYLEVKMPEEQLDKLKLAIEKGKMDNRREQRRILRTRVAASAAAVIAAFIILPNTSSSVAYAMERVPVLGNLVKLVTWRDYKYEDERHLADVEVGKLELVKSDEENVALGSSFDEVEEAIDVAVEEKLNNSMEEINVQVEEITENLIAEFETHVQEEMGYHDLVVKSEVIADNDKYFTLKLLCFQAAGSGYEWNYFYTIDMTTGEQLQLKDLFKEEADYITVISEEIKKQMREQMEADENVFYWLEEEMEEWNFKSITEETSFYLNEEGKLVISFNEAEVAPAYMGVVEFVIEEDVVKDILKQ